MDKKLEMKKTGNTEDTKYPKFPNTKCEGMSNWLVRQRIIGFIVSFPNRQELVERFGSEGCFRIFHTFHTENQKFGHL